MKDNNTPFSSYQFTRALYLAKIRELYFPRINFRDSTKNKLSEVNLIMPLLKSHKS